MSAKTQNSKLLHVVMFPWVSYGHIIPFLHLSNKLAERGHGVSFLLPESAQHKVESLNQYPNLIQFYPLLIPRVDGLPPGAETTSDVPFSLQNYLFTAFDKTQDQVQFYLSTLRPADFVFYDFAYWIPGLGSFKSILYTIVNAVSLAFYVVPCRAMIKGVTTVEDLMQSPPGFPSSSITLQRHEAAQSLGILEERGVGLSFYQRLVRCFRDSDALAMRTCGEIEGPFCDYIAHQYAKPVFPTGLALPETSAARLEEKWVNWLNNFGAGSVVYCSFGSQIILQKDQFQELVLGFELTGLPFIAALTPPQGCSTIEEALPEGFEERVQGRGWVYGGWVPQPQIVKHPSVGCSVNHCGPGTLWESLLCDCQIVLIPHLADQVMGTKLMVEELKVAVEAERGENRWIAKESLSKAIKLVMDKDGVAAADLRNNHAKLRSILSNKDLQESYIDNLISNMQDLLESKS